MPWGIKGASTHGQVRVALFPLLGVFFCVLCLATLPVPDCGRALTPEEEGFRQERAGWAEATTTTTIQQCRSRHTQST